MEYSTEKGEVMSFDEDDVDEMNISLPWIPELARGGLREPQPQKKPEDPADMPVRCFLTGTYRVPKKPRLEGNMR